MLEYLRIDGIDLHDYVSGGVARDVAKVDGLIGLTAPKGDSKQRSDGHGSAPNRSRFLSAKIVTIEGELWGTTDDDAYAAHDELEAVLYRTLSEGPKLLTYKRAGAAGLALQRLVKLASPLEPPVENDATTLRYQLMLEADDPRAYSQALRTAVGAALSAGGGGLTFPMTFPIRFTTSAGGTATVTNGGRVETPPLVRVYGPVTSPTYRLVTTGEEVKITGTINAGEYLVVDHDKRTLTLNGVTRRMNFLDTPNSRFFQIPPDGDFDVRMFATNFGAGAHIEVDTRDAYGG